MHIEENNDRNKPKLNDTPEFSETSVAKNTEVEKLVQAVSQGDAHTSQAVVGRLTAHPGAFQPAVPAILTMVASGNEELRRCAADMLSNRAHWIKEPDLNEFLVPAVVRNLPTIQDKWTGDLLITATLSAAPGLNHNLVPQLADAAHRQLCDESGVPLTQQASLGLLSDRMPLMLSPVVGEATRSVLHDFREDLLANEGAPPQLDSRSHWILRVSLTSLFGQRLTIGGRCSSGRSIAEGRALSAECRRYIETFCNLVEQGNAPQWAGAYHMLFTSTLLIPTLDNRSREALVRTQQMFSEDLPVASELISQLVAGTSLRPKLERILDEFDPGDVEQTFFFTSALMDSILRLEKGENLSGPQAAIDLDGQLGSVLQRVTDPLVAYFASELRRVLRKAERSF